MHGALILQVPFVLRPGKPQLRGSLPLWDLSLVIRVETVTFFVEKDMRYLS